eukprot:COSAG02_NODE_127_length_34879_cov_12.705060_20_plen_76_part_00
MNKASADLYMATGLKPNDPILQEDSDTDADVSTDDGGDEISVEESYKRSPASRCAVTSIFEYMYMYYRDNSPQNA